MSISVLVGLFVAADNVCAGLSLGAMVGRAARRTRIALAVGFGVCEVVSLLLGRAIGAGVFALGPNIDLVSAILFLGAGLMVLAGATGVQSPERLPRWCIALLPVLLSMDNLFAGMSVGVADWSLLDVGVAGLVSGAVSALAMGLGARFVAWLPARRSLIAGVALLLSATVVAAG